MIDKLGNLMYEGKVVYPNTTAKAVKYTDSDGNPQTLEKLIQDVENIKKNGSGSINGEMTWDELESQTII